jgi:hypothetical protein
MISVGARSFAARCALLAPLLRGLAPASALEPRLEGDEAERFLRAAAVVEMTPLSVGVTKSHQVTLRLGTRTAQGIWKTIDKFSLRQRFTDGRLEGLFRDTYKHEIAAYELDKLLGLGLVPPTVERRIEGETGSLQLWIEGAMSEAERLSKGLHAPDVERWNRQMHGVRLLHQLTDNTDYRNISNLLIGPDFSLYAIDFSRAFRLHRDLRKEDALKRFPRPVLERLRGLTPKLAHKRLGRWLTKQQIKTLLARRDRVVDLATRRIAEHGEEAVLLP